MISTGRAKKSSIKATASFYAEIAQSKIKEKTFSQRRVPLRLKTCPWSGAGPRTEPRRGRPGATPTSSVSGSDLKPLLLFRTKLSARLARRRRDGRRRRRRGPRGPRPRLGQPRMTGYLAAADPVTVRQHGTTVLMGLAGLSTGLRHRESWTGTLRRPVSTALSQWSRGRRRSDSTFRPACQPAGPCRQRRVRPLLVMLSKEQCLGALAQQQRQECRRQ